MWVVSPTPRSSRFGRCVPSAPSSRTAHPSSVGLLQGRLDLLGEEATRRADGAGGNLEELVSGLADLMSEGVRAAGSGRLDQQLDPPEAVVGPLTAALDARVGPSVIMAVAELGDDELSAARQALQDFEEELSSARRSLHRAIDVLNAELARRIALGESSASPS